MSYVPELGQMAFGAHYESLATPNYVTAGIESIDDLYCRHVEGKDVENTFRPGRTSKSVEEAVVNEVFALRSYNWSEGWDDDTPGEPNFEHFASGIKAYWYKHAERGETINQLPNRQEWLGIQRECEDWILAQPKAFRVLVTGSRDWAPELYVPEIKMGKEHPSYKRLADDWRKRESPDRAVMISAFQEARQRAEGRHMVVIEGGASGADRLARMLASSATNCHVETHLANWNRQEDGSYDRAAGFKRNQEMVDSGADLCLAFFKKGAGNRGTKHCSDLARKAGIEVVEVWN